MAKPKPAYFQTVLKGVSYCVFVCFLTLLLLEIVLRIWGWSIATRGGDVAAKGGIRVLCLGDSFTYGVGASDPKKSSYPRQLQSRFDARKGCSVRVINRGVPGENSSRIRAHFEENLLKFRPRAVLVMAGMNNLWNVMDAYSVLDDPTVLDRLESALFHFKAYRLFRIAKYNLAFRLEHGRSPLKLPDDYDSARSVLDKKTHYPYETEVKEGDITCAIPHSIVLRPESDEKIVLRIRQGTVTMIRDIGIMKKIADKYGVTLVLMTYPNIFHENYALIDYAEKNKLPLINNMGYIYGKIPATRLREYFQKESGPVQLSHPNEKGYGMMADLISRELPRFDPALKACAADGTK